MKRTSLLLLSGWIACQAIAQDDCAGALPIGMGAYTVTQVNGTEVPMPVCSTGGMNATAGEWYVFTSAIDTAITVSTDLPANAGLDTRFQVYTGSCGALLCYSGDDDSGNGYLSRATFTVTAGTDYYIAFDDNWSAEGFQFVVLGALPPPPEPGGFTPQFIAVNGDALCIVDMNADGLDDAVSVTATNINVNFQQSGGGFVNTNFPTTNADNTPYWSMCAGDLDGNGYNDLCYAGGGLTFMMANADGTAYTELSQPQPIFCQRSNLVDINNDGHLDAFSCHDVEPNVYYLNDGNNNFVWHQGGLGDTPDGGNYGSIWVDYDNDHDVDMFIAKCRGAGSPASIDQLHRNNGDGTFTDVAASMNLADYQQSWSSAWGDFDNDGDMDVLIGASSFSGGGHKLMRNDGTTFTNVTAGSGFDLFTGTSIEFVTHDFNNDGYLDVLGGEGYLQNNGDMTFTITPVGPTNGPVGDLNNDGFLDVMNGNAVYMNDGNDNNFLRIITVGTTSNTNGIGARVQITSALGTQIRDVRSGDGFTFMSSLATHFGLGPDTEVSNVTVYWPSGIVSSIADPAINGTLTIVEGETGTSVPVVPSAELSLFPTPAESTLHLRSMHDLTNRTVTITDVSGKIVSRSVLQNGSVDVSSFTSGIYLLQVDGAGTRLQGKFVKR